MVLWCLAFVRFQMLLQVQDQLVIKQIFIQLWKALGNFTINHYRQKAIVISYRNYLILITRSELWSPPTIPVSHHCNFSLRSCLPKWRSRHCICNWRPHFVSLYYLQIRWVAAKINLSNHLAREKGKCSSMPQGPGALTTLALPTPYPRACPPQNETLQPTRGGQVGGWTGEWKKRGCSMPSSLSERAFHVRAGCMPGFRNARSFSILNVVMQSKYNTELQEQL